MNATETTRVEIDARIRERPELLHAVEDATDYLTAQATDVPPPTAIDWQFADEDGESIRITLSDSPDTPRSAGRSFWTRWLLNPVSRKMCVLKVWGELLGKRSDVQMARIGQLIAQLNQEITDGGEDVE